MRHYLTIAALIALAPVSASAQCMSAGTHATAEYAAFEANFPQPDTNVETRNAAIMRASLGEDLSHSTDADLD